MTDNIVHLCKSYEHRMVGLLRPSIKEGPEIERNIYLTGKLISEAGEVHGEVLKNIFHDKDNGHTLLEEVGDVLWYVFNILHLCDSHTRNYVYSTIEWCNNQKSRGLLESSENLMESCYAIYKSRLGNSMTFL